MQLLKDSYRLSNVVNLNINGMKQSYLSKVQLGLFILFLMGYASLSYGQKTIQAQEIVDALKDGQNVSYENVTITGVMDMTAYAEKAANLPKKRGYNSKDIENHIKGDLTFKNCRFDDHVYAYFNDDNISHTKGNSKYTFVTNFRGNVIFENALLKKELGLSTAILVSKRSLLVQNSTVVQPLSMLNSLNMQTLQEPHLMMISHLSMQNFGRM
jgi:hypothetical protein